MNIKIMLLSLVIPFGIYVLNAQTKAHSFKKALRECDSIQLVSHQDLHENGTFAELEQGISGHWHLLVSTKGLVNDTIIIERVNLSKGGIDSLLSIVIKKYKEEAPMNRASCFNPHEAILLYKDGICSFVDICFGCLQFSTSGDMNTEKSFLSTYQNWMDLQTLFIGYGVKYKIEPILRQ